MEDKFQITLSAARVNANYSQKKAAQLLHVDPMTLRNWEKGITYPTSKKIEEMEILYKISKDRIKFA
ncbi:MAG: helix-turn-helix transcriptional regulator [Clostridia bacterium]